VLAHAGNPNFRSKRDVHDAQRVRPSTSTSQNYDDRLQAINHSGKTVTIYGYNDEPYAQLLPNGNRPGQQEVRPPTT